MSVYIVWVKHLTKNEFLKTVETFGLTDSIDADQKGLFQF